MISTSSHRDASSHMRFFSCADRRILSQERRVMPAIMPLRTDSAITIASDASKCQERKETATGPAFWTENRTTTHSVITPIIRENILPPHSDLSGTMQSVFRIITGVCGREPHDVLHDTINRRVIMLLSSLG